MTQYGPETTTNEVLDGLDLSGRRIVITGGGTGLGREAARAFAAQGAVVTVLVRAGRAESTAVDLSELVAPNHVEVEILDLGDLDSIRSLSDRFSQSHEAIDILINNAGVMACPKGHTVDGFETQFGTNHLGHFLLTARLFPLLMRGESPRVVTLSSAGHSRADVDLIDPNFEHTEYSPWTAYGQSKTANALFARELANRAGDQGLLSFSVHPGVIVTDLGRHLNDELIADMMAFSRVRAERAGAPPSDPSSAMRFKSVEAGAATEVWGAVADELVGHNGAYLADCGLGVLGGNPSTNGFLPYLLDDDHAAALWELSETLIGERFEV